MKRFIMILWIVLLVLILVPAVGATTYVYDLYDNLSNGLNHDRYYRWGFNWTFDNPVVNASLFLNGIYNWDNNPHDLYIHVFDDSYSTSSGVSFSSGWDGQSGGDYFGPDDLLAHYDETDFNTTPTNYDISFAPWALNYIADGEFTIAIDPDCHYWAEDLTLSAETAPTPEPASILLIGTGLIGIAGFRKRFRR